MGEELLDVNKAERGRGAPGSCVFSGTKKEIEGEGDHVGHGGMDGVSTSLGNTCDMEENGGRGGLDVVWWWVDCS